MPRLSRILILVSVTLSAMAQIAFKFGVSSQPSDSVRATLGPFAFLVNPGVKTGTHAVWCGNYSMVDRAASGPAVANLSIRRGWFCFDNAGRLVALWR